MDSVTLVVNALVAGATQAVGDAAKEGVLDIYHCLRTSIASLFRGNQQAEGVLKSHESDPETWDKPLRKLVAETGADTVPEVLEAAQQLMKLLDPNGSAEGKYQVVDARFNRGRQQFGSGSTQVNIGNAIFHTDHPAIAIDDRFTKAIEQLGNENRDMRIGGIYALERLMKDSPADQPTIVEILTKFVREHSPWSGELSKTALKEKSKQPEADIQATLSVLGRRTPVADERPLDLSFVDMRGARLENANLGRAGLSGTNLQKAILVNANLQQAVLVGVDFRGAWLLRADLEGAGMNNPDQLDAMQHAQASNTDKIIYLGPP